MRIENKMYLQVKKLGRLVPRLVRSQVVSRIMGCFVPFINTAGIRFETLTREKVIVLARNRRRVQNHIKGVHACVTALISETATGFVTNMNCPADKLILLKEMRIEYIKVAQGNLTAVAYCTDDMAERIFKEPKGHFSVPVKVIDQNGNEPVQVEMIWAWIPKK